MLIFPLKKEWYEKIKNGEKTIEYREVKPYWQSRLYNEIGLFPEQTQIIKPIPCKLRLGYTNRYMIATITKIEIIDGKNTDLHIDKPVYAIHLNIKKQGITTSTEKDAKKNVCNCFLCKLNRGVK